MNQRDRLLTYIKRHGEISWDTALTELHIYRLSARIDELRKSGHRIETFHTRKPHRTKYIFKGEAHG